MRTLMTSEEHAQPLMPHHWFICWKTKNKTKILQSMTFGCRFGAVKFGSEGPDRSFKLKSGSAVTGRIRNFIVILSVLRKIESKTPKIVPPTEPLTPRMICKPCVVPCDHCFVAFMFSARISTFVHLSWQMSHNVRWVLTRALIKGGFPCNLKSRKLSNW